MIRECFSQAAGAQFFDFLSKNSIAERQVMLGRENVLGQRRESFSANTFAVVQRFRWQRFGCLVKYEQRVCGKKKPGILPGIRGEG